MGTNTAGTVSSGNEGKTDKGRGSVDKFGYSKASRATGKTGSVGSSANSDKPDANKRTVSDPRLV